MAKQRSFLHLIVSKEIINETHDYVDAHHIGKLQYEGKDLKPVTPPTTGTKPTNPLQDPLSRAIDERRKHLAPSDSDDNDTDDSDWEE